MHPVRRPGAGISYFLTIIIGQVRIIYILHYIIYNIYKILYILYIYILSHSNWSPGVENNKNTSLSNKEQRNDFLMKDSALEGKKIDLREKIKTDDERFVEI